MHHRRRLISASITAAAAVLLTAGCASRPTAPVDDRSLDGASSRAKGQVRSARLYLYFPQAEVYYAPDRDLYFWRSAGFWGVGQHLPSNYRLGDAPAPLLLLETDKPYRLHERVAAEFPRRQATGAGEPVSSLAGVSDTEPAF